MSVLGAPPQWRNTSRLHPKKGSHFSPSQFGLLSTSRSATGSSPFLEQRVSLSSPISTWSWKHACPNCYLRMEIIRLFLHEKQILYFPQSENSHCNKHGSEMFGIEEGVTRNYKKQLSLES